MKKFLLSASAFFAMLAYAQEKPIDSTKHWSVIGQNTLMLNQAAFSNWVGGGANSFGWLAGVNYNLVYKKDKNLVENAIILGYGQNKTQGLGTRKSQDNINLSSNYGYEIGKMVDSFRFVYPLFDESLFHIGSVEIGIPSKYFEEKFEETGNIDVHFLTKQEVLKINHTENIKQWL